MLEIGVARSGGELRTRKMDAGIGDHDAIESLLMAGGGEVRTIPRAEGRAGEGHFWTMSERKQLFSPDDFP